VVQAVEQAAGDLAVDADREEDDRAAILTDAERAVRRQTIDNAYAAIRNRAVTQ
jgi:hypothetical protein